MNHVDWVLKHLPHRGQAIDTFTFALWISLLVGLKSNNQVLCHISKTSDEITETCRDPVIKPGICDPPTSGLYCRCPSTFHFYDKKCSKVSPPKQISYTVKRFNTITRLFDVNISWSKPLYAANKVWGYELSYHPKHCVAGLEPCIWLPSNKLWFVLNSLTSECTYDLSVLSLPRYKISTEQGNEKIMKLPDLCKTEAKLGLELSFRCSMVTDFKVLPNCANGRVDIEWNNGGYTNYDGYVVQLSISNTNNFTKIELHKNTTNYHFKNLEYGRRYGILVAFLKNGKSKDKSKSRHGGYFCPKPCIVEGKKHQEGDRFVSSNCTQRCICGSNGVPSCTPFCPKQKIACEPGTEVIQTVSKISNSTNCSCSVLKCTKKGKHTSSKLIAILLGIGFAIALTGVSIIIFTRLLQKRRSRILEAKIPSDPELFSPSSPDSSDSTKIGPKVLVFYFPGCRYVEFMVIMFVDLLRKSGMNASSFAHESILVHELTPMGYLNDRLRKIDYSITFYTERCDSNDCGAAMIYNKGVDIFCNENASAKYRSKHISFYLKWPHINIGGNYVYTTSEFIPPTIEHHAYAFPAQIKDVVIRLLSSNQRLSSATCKVQLDKPLMTLLHDVTIIILEASHKKCYSGQCRRGTRLKVDRQLLQDPSGIEEAISRASSTSSSSSSSSFNHPLNALKDEKEEKENNGLFQTSTPYKASESEHLINSDTPIPYNYDEDSVFLET